MRKIVIGWIFLVTSFYVSANDRIDLGTGFHDFTSEIEELSFKIKSKKINELISIKLLLEKDNNIYAEAIWKENETKLSLSGVEKVSKQALKRIKEVFEAKAKFVTGQKFHSWIKGYELNSKSKGRDFHYEDSSGLLDRSDIIVSQDKKRLKITEKFPTGDIVTEYLYISPPWSRGSKVLTRVVRVQKEENKIETTINHFTYAKQKKSKWMLSNIQIDTTQKLNIKSQNPVNRKITESFTFYDYKITQ